MIGKVIGTLLGAAIDGIRRYPVTSLALIATAIVANLDIADWLDIPRQTKEPLYMAFAGFALASLSKQIGIASRGFSKLLQHGSAIAAGGVVAALVWFANDIAMNKLAFFAGLSGSLLVAAHWFRGTSSGLWFYIVRFLFSTGLAFLAATVFALGFSAIFASLDYLFGINVPKDIYAHVWATSLIAAGPIFALGTLPADFDTEPLIDGDNYGIAGLRLLSDFLAAPMLAIYALILHAYALKILITGEVPQNKIGWMVLGYGALIIFFWKVMLPLHEVLTASGRMFLRLWPFFIIVPMGLLFYAVWLRIHTYGVTPERYFLAAFGVLITLFALMQAVPRLRNWLPAATPLTVLALLAGGFGPWGAQSVSVKSQVKQFASLLDQNSLVQKGEGARAAGILYFLRKNNGLEGLRALAANLKDNPFARGESHEQNYKLESRLAAAFRVDAARKEDDRNRLWRNYRFKSQIIETAGYDLFYSNVTLHTGPGMDQQRKMGRGISFRIADNALIVSQGEGNTSFSLDPVIKALAGQSEQQDARGIVLTSGEKKILLVPIFININDKDGAKVQGGAGHIFLRSADWPQ